MTRVCFAELGTAKLFVTRLNFPTVTNGKAIALCPLLIICSSSAQPRRVADLNMEGQDFPNRGVLPPSQGMILLELVAMPSVQWTPADPSMPTEREADFHAWLPTINSRSDMSAQTYAFFWSTRAELDAMVDRLQHFPFTGMILNEVSPLEEASAIVVYFIDKLNMTTLRTLRIDPENHQPDSAVLASLSSYLWSERSHGLRHLEINGKHMELDERKALLPAIRGNYTLRTLYIRPHGPPMGEPAGSGKRYMPRWEQEGYGFTPIYHDYDRQLVRNGKIAKCVWMAALRALVPARVILRGRLRTADDPVDKVETPPDNLAAAPQAEPSAPAQVPQKDSATEKKAPGASSWRLGRKLSAFLRSSPAAEASPETSRTGSARSSRPFPILDLPLEVQFHILALASDHPAQLSARQWSRLFKHAADPGALTVLAADLRSYRDQSLKKNMEEWFDNGGIWYEEGVGR
ncbi:hypothetical protein Q8F55_005836 [Vanrija albida]|uniref:F-box domain-containing protein n=1 Tax=Vanrija albida TaxID=181172 RepID=A0ABR3Q3J2_9TREE